MTDISIGRINCLKVWCGTSHHAGRNKLFVKKQKPIPEETRLNYFKLLEGTLYSQLSPENNEGNTRK